MTEIIPTDMDAYHAARIDGTGPDPWGHVSSRRAAREFREQRAALFQPIRADRIRAVHRIDRRAKVVGFFHRRVTGWLAFLVIVGLAFLAGLLAIKLMGAS